MPRPVRFAVPCLAVALTALGASAASADPGLTGKIRLTSHGTVALPLRVDRPERITVSGDVAVGRATIAAVGRAPDGTTRTLSVPRDHRRATPHVQRRMRHAGRVLLSVPVDRRARGMVILRIRFSNAPYEFFSFVRLHRR